MWKISATKDVDSVRDKHLAALLVQAQLGNPEAYEKFLIETSKLLRRYLCKRMETDVVEDVLQETLLSIHRVRHTYIPGRPVGPWLYAICAHRMTDFYRQNRRIQQVEIGLDESEAPTVQAHHKADGLAASVLDILARLPDRQRRIIEMLKIYGHSVKEVALHTGMSESSVKTTAFRGYEAIRKFIGVNK
jgi:RNA polymerase sigma-70 factor (ECF subfamily)